MRNFGISSLALAAFIGFGGPVWADTDIQVSATAKIIAPNDVVRVSVDDESKLYETSKGATNGGAKRVLELKAMLESFGLKAGTDFVINNVRVWPEYAKGDYREVIGHKAHFSGEIVLGHDRDDADTIYKSVSAKFKIGQPNDSLSKAGRADAEYAARIEIAEQARKKAAAFAAGLRCKLGQVKLVKEGESDRYGYGYESAARSLSSRGPVSDTVAAERTSTVSASAEVTFSCGTPVQ